IGRLCRAAGRRSGSGAGDSRQDVRHISGARTPEEDRAARHHRRYRREEPRRSPARAMAVAADAARRHRHQPDPARRRGDRVRLGVLRGRPPQSRYRGRYVQQPR
ncbi:hypothetical protein SA9_12385, partial [Staphylococcus warneri]